MSRINYRIFLAGVLSFVFFFSFFQTSQAGFFDWFKWFRKNDSSRSTPKVISDTDIKQDTFYTLSVSKSGSGVVTSDDRKINCGKQCKASYPANSKIVLKAEADNNYKFERWNGCDKISDGKCQTTLNKSKMIVAKFASKTPASSSSQKSSSLSKSSKTNISKYSSKASSSKSFSSSLSSKNSSSILSSFSSSSSSSISNSSAPVKSNGFFSSSFSEVTSSGSSSSENFITSPRTSIPWTVGVLVLDGIDQNSKAIEPLEEAIGFVENFSKFDIIYTLAFSSFPHTYTKYDCQEGLQTCVVVNYYDVNGAVIDALPVADSYVIFWNRNNQPPLQAGSTWGVTEGIFKGGIKRPYATIPVDIWWYDDNSQENFKTRSAQIISHELINSINAKLETAPYYCAPLVSDGADGDTAYKYESDRLKKLTDDCYNKYP